MRMSDLSSDVCSADLIGHRPALEIALPQRLLPVRIVDEDDDRLSLYVDIRIIVPAPFRCIYAIARKDDVGLRHLYLRPGVTDARHHTIGRASCRARWCQYG